MLEKLRKNKTFWIVIIVAIVILVGFGITVLVSKNSKQTNKKDKTDESDISLETEYKNENDENDEKNGLQVEEGDVTPNVSIDASGAWDDTASDKVDSNENIKEEEQNTTSNKNDNETDEKETTESNVSDGSILEGESWTKPR